MTFEQNHGHLAEGRNKLCFSETAKRKTNRRFTTVCTLDNVQESVPRLVAKRTKGEHYSSGKSGGGFVKFDFHRFPGDEYVIQITHIYDKHSRLKPPRSRFCQTTDKRCVIPHHCLALSRSLSQSNCTSPPKT